MSDSITLIFYLVLAFMSLVLLALMGLHTKRSNPTATVFGFVAGVSVTKAALILLEWHEYYATGLMLAVALSGLVNATIFRWWPRSTPDEPKHKSKSENTQASA